MKSCICEQVSTNRCMKVHRLSEYQITRLLSSSSFVLPTLFHLAPKAVWSRARSRETPTDLSNRISTRSGESVVTVEVKGMHPSNALPKHDINHYLNLLDSPNHCMLASSPIVRRQQFLIRSLRGYHDRTNMERTLETKCANGTAAEADAENILRRITPALDPSRHKGQAGKIAVFGGCREYTGAPYFAAISALKIGCVSEIMKLARQSNTPIVIDGDGLFLVTNNLDLVKGYPLAVLTPNVNEYKHLIQKVLDCEVNDQDAPQQLLSLAGRIGGATILRKGKSDLISDGETVTMVSMYGSPRRCGGQGDILSGSVALFSSWARQQTSATDDDSSNSPRNPMVLGCIAGSSLLRKAASLAFMNKKRATLTTDIIEYMGKSLEDICPAS